MPDWLTGLCKRIYGEGGGGDGAGEDGISTVPYIEMDGAVRPCGQTQTAGISLQRGALCTGELGKHLEGQGIQKIKIDGRAREGTPKGIRCRRSKVLDGAQSLPQAQGGKAVTVGSEAQAAIPAVGVREDHPYRSGKLPQPGG